MPAYEEQNHKFGSYLTSAEANHMEKGIAAAQSTGELSKYLLEAPEAAKAITAAKAETPSATKAVFVTLIVVLKAEATAFEILSGGKVVAKFKKGAAPTAGDIETFDFQVAANAVWEYKVTVGALTSAEAVYQFVKQ